MLTVFPNYAASKVDGEVCLEASHPLLFEALCASGGAVMVATQVHREPVEGNLLPLSNSAMRFMSLGVVDTAAPRGLRLLNYFRQIGPIIRAVRQSAFCYIFAPGHVGLLAAMCCWLTGRPYGLYLRGDWKEITPAVFQMLQHHLLSRAQFILYTGRELSSAVATVNPHCEAVVPMSSLLFAAVPDKAKVRHPAEASGPKSALTVLFVGQILRYKGVFELLEAFDRVAESADVAVNLIYVGEGADRPSLQAEINKRHRQDVVRCVGPITELNELGEIFSSSDVFCLPTRHEGFPRVLYEAMQFSLPILTTPVSQIPTVIEDGRNGLFCEAGSVDSIAQQLQRLILDPALRQTLGAAGHATLQPLLSEWRGRTHGHQVLAWLQQLNGKSGAPTQSVETHD